MRFHISHDVRARDVMAGRGDGARAVRLRLFCQESRPQPTWKTFYSQNGPQELGLSFKFDCVQTGQVEGPALRDFEHITGAQNVVVDGLTRVFYMELRKVSPSVRYCFKDDSTQRIFRMDESEIEFQDTGDIDSEDDELEILKAHDEDSEV